ncbi:MAG: alpha/beta fold hydrolase [Candidatus Dormibacteria bacterium]
MDSPQPASQPVVEERFVAYEGGTLRYVIGGSGPPMVLCHGFIGAAENFDTWLSALLPRRTVVIPDLPGFGKSSPLIGRHSPAALARAVVTAADHAGVDRYDIAGLCLGSSIAMALQRHRPQSARRVILHTPLLRPDLVRRRFHMQVDIMTAPGVWPAIVWLGHRRVVSDLYKRLMVEGSDVDPVAAQINFDNQMRATPRAAREWLHDGLRCDEVALLHQTTQPVMIIAARHDRIIDVRRIEQTLGGRANVHVALIDDAGHAWTKEMGARQNAAIAAFLDGRPVPGALAAA